MPTDKFRVQQAVTTRPLVGDLEKVLDRLDNEHLKALIELRKSYNSLIQEFVSGQVTLGTSGLVLRWGSGAPTTADPSGSVYLRTDGGAGTTLYVREGAVWTGK